MGECSSTGCRYPWEVSHSKSRTCPVRSAKSPGLLKLRFHLMLMPSECSEQEFTKGKVNSRDQELAAWELNSADAVVPVVHGP